MIEELRTARPLTPAEYRRQARNRHETERKIQAALRAGTDPGPLRRGVERPHPERPRNLTRIRGWAWWFVASGWPVAEVAELFDVPAELLSEGDEG